MSRSNINLVGNTTFGQNVGTGEEIYKGKDLGNILQFKSLCVTGTTMAITCDENHIYFSAATGSGGSPAGTTGSVQFYDGGNFGGGTNLVWDDANGWLYVCGDSSTCLRTVGDSAGLLICSTVDSSYGQVCMNSSGQFYVRGNDQLWLSNIASTNARVALGNLMQGDTWVTVRDPNTANHTRIIGVYSGTTSRFAICKDGGISMPNLPAKSTETDVVYIDGSGNLSCGAAGGGSGTVTSVASGNGMNFTTITATGTVTMGTPSSVSYTSTNSLTSNSHTHALSLDAFAALTSNSSVSWDTSGGLNKTWSINGSYTLTLTNVASGMYGTVQVTVTSGTPTITMAGSGITFKGNGSLASLATGTYMLAWVATSSTTVNYNIADYS